MIYFAQRIDSGRIKIGTTGDVAKRLRELASQTKADLRVIAVADGDRKTEERLHWRFGPLRVEGEWFHPGEDLIGYITQDVGLLDPPIVATPRGKIGRPKKGPEEARSARINIRVRPDYSAWLRHLATTAGDETLQRWSFDWPRMKPSG